MNRRITLLTLVVAILLPGCTVPSVCDFYNNTGKLIEVEIVRRDPGVRIVSLDSGSIKRIKEWNGVREVKVRLLNNAKEIEEAWEYKNPPVPEVEHWKWRGWWIFARHFFEAQIETNGEISILGKNQSFPISPDDAAITIRPTVVENVKSPNKSAQSDALTRAAGF